MTATTKPDRKTLNAVAAAAKKVNASARSLTTKGKTYEVWMMFEIAAALGAAHKVCVKDHAGNKTRIFYARGGPGYIRPKNSMLTGEPCHIEFEGRAGKVFEMHNSVQHVGASGVLHELDISVVPFNDAEKCRNVLPNGSPFDGPRLAGMELKAYDKRVTLNQVIPRALFGMAVDLDISAAIGIVAFFTKTFRHLRGLHLNTRPRHWLITTARIRSSSRAFLTCYGIGAAQRIQPGTAGPLVADIVRYLRRLR